MAVKWYKQIAKVEKRLRPKHSALAVPLYLLVITEDLYFLEISANISIDTIISIS